MRPSALARALINRLKGVDKKYWQFSSVEGLYWFMAAAGGYLTVFVQGMGWNASQVGQMNAINSAVAIIASPFWGTLSDKMRSIKRALLICLVIGCGMWMMVPGTANTSVFGISLIWLIVPVSGFFRTPAMSLCSGLTIHNANKYRLNYGGIRLWGSITYSVMAMLLGVVLPYIGVSSTFYIYGILGIPLIILIFSIKDDGQKQKSIKFKDMQIGRLFKDYYYVTFIIFYVVLSIPNNSALSFMPYLMSETGVDASRLGLVMGYKAIMEVPILITLTRLRMRISMPKLMMISATLFATESMLYSLSNGLISLIAISTLHGLGGGILIGCAMNYIYRLAPDDLKATAQTVSAATNSMAGIISGLLGGALIDTIGVRKFYMVCSMAIIFALLFFIMSFYIGKKVLKKPLPEAARPGI